MDIKSICIRHGFYLEEEIEIAEEIILAVRQHSISYSSAISALELAKDILGDSISVSIK